MVKGTGLHVLKLPVDFRREFWKEIGCDAEGTGEIGMDETRGKGVGGGR